MWLWSNVRLHADCSWLLEEGFGEGWQQKHSLEGAPTHANRSSSPPVCMFPFPPLSLKFCATSQLPCEPTMESGERGLDSTPEGDERCTCASVA